MGKLYLYATYIQDHTRKEVTGAVIMHLFIGPADLSTYKTKNHIF